MSEFEFYRIIKRERSENSVEEKMNELAQRGFKFKAAVGDIIIMGVEIDPEDPDTEKLCADDHNIEHCPHRESDGKCTKKEHCPHAKPAYLMEASDDRQETELRK